MPYLPGEGMRVSYDWLTNPRLQRALEIKMNAYHDGWKAELCTEQPYNVLRGVGIAKQTSCHLLYWLSILGSPSVNRGRGQGRSQTSRGRKPNVVWGALYCGGKCTSVGGESISCHSTCIIVQCILGERA